MRQSALRGQHLHAAQPDRRKREIGVRLDDGRGGEQRGEVHDAFVDGTIRMLTLKTSMSILRVRRSATLKEPAPSGRDWWETVCRSRSGLDRAPTWFSDFQYRLLIYQSDPNIFAVV